MFFISGCIPDSIYWHIFASPSKLLWTADNVFEGPHLPMLPMGGRPHVWEPQVSQ